MSPRKLFPNKTNGNRASAGSGKGIEGRTYPKFIAQKLNADKEFRCRVCKAISKKATDFEVAIAGNDLPTYIESVGGRNKPLRAKTTLRIIWKDGTRTNFRTTISDSCQIHLQKANNFIEEFSAKYRCEIPAKVQDALRLFSGSHKNQGDILESIPVDYVGEAVRRKVESNYFNRLTLASMYGYDEEMPLQLLEWLRQNCDKVFLFCFASGAAKDQGDAVDFMWYRTGNSLSDGFEIYNLTRIASAIRAAMQSKEMRAKMVRPNDKLQIGSTIALPFGNLQQHENDLQFRHNRWMMAKLNLMRTSKKSNFGSAPKLSGHKNEEMIAEALNRNSAFRAHFCERVGIPEDEFVAATAGGKHAPQVESVIGGKTAEKTDVRVLWRGGGLTNISIKKDSAGQIYLVTAKNFIAAYEAQYKTTVPDNVRRALALFIGEASDSKSILDATDTSVDGEFARKIAYEQNYRLVFEVIRSYDAKMAEALLDWLKTKITTVCELCFSAGAVKDREKWANVLWYKNLVDADGQGLDFLVPISRILSALEKNGDRNVVERGPKNAGSTILLPFGHLQYHLKQLEFYQQLKKIKSLLATVQ